VAVANEDSGIMDSGRDFGNGRSDGNIGLEAVVEVFGPAAVIVVVLPAAVVEGLVPHAVMETWVL